MCRLQSVQDEGSEDGRFPFKLILWVLELNGGWCMEVYMQQAILGLTKPFIIILNKGWIKKLTFSYIIPLCHTRLHLGKGRNFV